MLLCCAVLCVVALHLSRLPCAMPCHAVWCDCAVLCLDGSGMLYCAVLSVTSCSVLHCQLQVTGFAGMHPQ